MSQSRVLVTGAAGFVGKWLCAHLLQHGYAVTGGFRSPNEVRGLSSQWQTRLDGVSWVQVDVHEPSSIDHALDPDPDSVVHLAAVSSGAEARRDPAAAWTTNCIGTVHIGQALERRDSAARLVLASTGEVYGRDLTRPAQEADLVAPASPYAASKAAAELAVFERHRRTGSDVVVLRPFTQTGPSQTTQFFVPAVIERVGRARRDRAGSVEVGNLDVVREFLDVRDVAAAIHVALEHGTAGEVYNIATANGISLRSVFGTVARLMDWEGEALVTKALQRRADIPYLVGDGTRLRALGWRDAYDLETTIQDMIAEDLGEESGV